MNEYPFILILLMHVNLLRFLHFVSAFDKRWCVLEHGNFTYYLNETVSTKFYYSFEFLNAQN